MDRLAAMSDDEVVSASMQRVSGDVEKLTRRNMKECVSEYIQTKCLEDPAFARLAMHPKKTMVRCFQYINRKAWEYIQDELKASGIRPGRGEQAYSCDIPMTCAISGRRITSVTRTPRRTRSRKKSLFPIPTMANLP